MSVEKFGLIGMLLLFVVFFTAWGIRLLKTLDRNDKILTVAVMIFLDSFSLYLVYKIWEWALR